MLRVGARAADHSGMHSLDQPITILRTIRFSKLLVALLALFAFQGMALTSLAFAAPHRHHARRAHQTSKRLTARWNFRREATNAVAATTTGPAPLQFGIYPGGAAGAVNPVGPTIPDNTKAELKAVQQLEAPGEPFVVHLYAEYYGTGSWTVQQEAGSLIDMYAKNGIKVELVVCYRPTTGTAAANVSGFDAWINTALSQYGKELSYLQVTNEDNVTNSGNTSDGWYPGSWAALVWGIRDAKTFINARDLNIKVGFNWAYQLDANEVNFWNYIKTNGGSAFLTDLDWVGLDIYPGTWGPAMSSTLNFASGVSAEMTSALGVLRSTYLPMAGIPASVPIHISETGYPTSATRTYDQQTGALVNEVNAVNAVRGVYNVTDFRWFDLRDANSASTSFESHYGIMTDSYTPKPAFAQYQQLIAQLSVPGAPV